MAADEALLGHQRAQEGQEKQEKAAENGQEKQQAQTGQESVEKKEAQGQPRAFSGKQRLTDGAVNNVLKVQDFLDRPADNKLPNRVLSGTGIVAGMDVMTNKDVPVKKAVPTKAALVSSGVQSLFDQGTEGWTVSGDAQGDSVTPNNRGGALSAKDNATGGVWYWRAPQKFLGDKPGAYGRTLSFDLRQSATDQLMKLEDMTED